MPGRHFAVYQSPIAAIQACERSSACGLVSSIPGKRSTQKRPPYPGESVRPDASESPTSASGQARPTTPSTPSARASSGPHGTTATRLSMCLEIRISLAAAATGRRSALQRSGFWPATRTRSPGPREGRARTASTSIPAAWSTATADVDGTSWSPTRNHPRNARPEAPRGQRHPASAASPKRKPAVRRSEDECDRCPRGARRMLLGDSASDELLGTAEIRTPAFRRSARARG